MAGNFPEIEKYLLRFENFSQDEINQIQSRLVPKSFKKKAFVLSEGEKCNYWYFVVKGLVRCFYINEKNKEQIIRFAIENWWFTNLESVIKKSPSQFYIQTLEPTQLLLLENKQLEDLYVKIPKLNKVFRKISEKTLMALQARYEFKMAKTSKDRYQNFLDELPGFSQRIPQYMLASYLNISPEYLSSLYKSKSKKTS